MKCAHDQMIFHQDCWNAFYGYCAVITDENLVLIVIELVKIFPDLSTKQSAIIHQSRRVLASGTSGSGNELVNDNMVQHVFGEHANSPVNLYHIYRVGTLTDAYMSNIRIQIYLNRLSPV